MKAIYLSGPINGIPGDTPQLWRELVQFELGDRYTYRNPLDRDYRGREAECMNEIVLNDLADINASDIVLALCHVPSWGTAMEIHHAFTIARKQVVAICAADRPSPWLRYHSHRIERTILDAVGFLKGASQQ